MQYSSRHAHSKVMVEKAVHSSQQNYLDPQYCLHSKGHVFDISTHPFPASDIKDFIVSMFNMQFIMCTLTANGQVVPGCHGRGLLQDSPI